MKGNNIVTLFVQNNEGKLLLQKRSPEKGGKFGFISGHAKPEETSKKAMIREMKEEMGVDIKESDIELFFRVKQEPNSYNMYYMKKDININSLILQKEEVEEAKWCTLEQIDKMIKENELYKNHIEAFDVVIKYLK